MQTTQGIIKEVASLIHRKELKSLGFKKSAYTWSRANEWPQVINLQLGRYNSAERSSFTLSFGVYIEQLHEALEACSVNNSIKEYDCDVRARIGQLQVDNEDYWWDVDVRSDANLLAESLLRVLREYGLPWLDKLQDFKSVASELIRQKQYFSAAIASSLTGEEMQASECMELAFSKAHRNALPKLKRIANKFCIPIPTHTDT